MKWIRRILLVSAFLLIGTNISLEMCWKEPESKPVVDMLLKAVMYIESSYKTEIINYKEDAVGILQIRPIMLREANRILALQGNYYRFSLEDRTDSIKSVQMWYIIQRYHNPEYDPMLAARIWNGGTKRYKPMSHQYWLKVKKQMI